VTLLELARTRRAARDRRESARATAGLLDAAAELRARAAGLPPSSRGPYLEEAELFESATGSRWGS
jgi:hypothetical protein